MAVTFSQCFKFTFKKSIKTTFTDLIRSAVPGYDTTGPNYTIGSERGVCNCLPDCEVTDYNIASSSGTLSRKSSMNHRNL